MADDMLLQGSRVDCATPTDPQADPQDPKTEEPRSHGSPSRPVVPPRRVDCADPGLPQARVPSAIAPLVLPCARLDDIAVATPSRRVGRKEHHCSPRNWAHERSSRWPLPGPSSSPSPRHGLCGGAEDRGEQIIKIAKQQLGDPWRLRRQRPRAVRLLRASSSTRTRRRVTARSSATGQVRSAGRALSLLQGEGPRRASQPRSRATSSCGVSMAGHARRDLHRQRQGHQHPDNGRPDPQGPRRHGALHGLPPHRDVEEARQRHHGGGLAQDEARPSQGEPTSESATPRPRSTCGRGPACRITASASPGRRQLDRPRQGARRQGTGLVPGPRRLADGLRGRLADR